MSESYSFRNALGGFHKEDVVRYVEFINNKHANQVNQLRTEMAAMEAELQKLRQNANLEEILTDLRKQYAQVEAERDDALAALEKAQRTHNEEIAALQRQVEELAGRKTAIINRNEEELEAYRRAEQAERQARQRAELICARAQAILADAGVKAEENARHIAAIADQTSAQLDVLQQAVSASKSTLQEVALSLYAIAPGESNP